MFKFFEDWISHIAWPTLKTFLGGVVHDELAAAAPVAQQAVSNLAAQELQALTSGNGAEAGAIAAKVVGDTAKQLADQGQKIGIHAVLAAVSAAVPASGA